MVCIDIIFKKLYNVTKHFKICQVDMKREGKKTIVRFNRIVLFCAVICCITGIIASSVMFFVLGNESNLPEETNILRGQMLFICFAVLLFFATVWCLSKWWITISFGERNVRYSRLFHRQYVKPYKYYHYIYYGYKAKTGNLIAESRKTYYIIITNQIFDEYELKHIDKVDMSYHTIKLIFTEGLCENLLRTFPDSHRKMLNDAIEGIKKDSMLL